MADQRARSLRGNSTIPERILWVALRKLKPFGLHFRRQAPIGVYIVDFVCHSAQIVVEVDGSQHGEPDAVRRDAERTKFLESQGYRVLRFGNVDVTQNSANIADAIYEIARHCNPHPKSLRDFDLPTRGR